MYRSIILMRHAKSDWGADFLTDHGRPLSKRGKKAAKAMGRFIRATHQVPDRVVTSSAIRATKTVELAALAGAWDCEVERTDLLYEAGSSDVLHVIRAQADAIRILLVTGHEPTWSNLLAKLIGGGTVRFPTASAARVDFDADSWSDVQFGSGRLIWLLPPRLLTDGHFRA